MITSTSSGLVHLFRLLWKEEKKRKSSGVSIGGTFTSLYLGYVPDELGYR